MTEAIPTSKDGSRAWTEEELERLQALDKPGASLADIARAMRRDPAEVGDQLAIVRLAANSSDPSG